MGKLGQRHVIQKILPFLTSFKLVYLLMIPVIIYYFAIAADRYVTTIILSVQSVNGTSSASTGLASLIGINNGSKEDTLFLQTYIHSLDMLKILEKEINIRSLYESQKLDFIFSLSPQEDMEGFLQFYKDRSKIIFNDISGLLKVEVEAFTPEDSKTIAQAILKESERFINEISHKAARDQMVFAEQELYNVKKRLQEAQNNLLAFQNQYGIFNPLKQAEAKTSLTIDIESKIAQKEVELITMQSYLNENAPQIIMLKSEIKALEKQLNKETSKVVSPKSSNKLNNLSARFQDLTIEVKFAEDAYTAALKAIEVARIQSQRKIKQLVIIQNANEPQSPTYPKKLYNIITIFAILSLLFGILKLINMIIEEHKY